MQENRFAVVAEVGERIADLSTPRPIVDEDRPAATFIRSRSAFGSRSEIDVEDGFRFGKPPETNLIERPLDLRKRTLMWWPICSIY